MSHDHTLLALLSHEPLYASQNQAVKGDIALPQVIKKKIIQHQP
jgi:hypothetical protein